MPTFNNPLPRLLLFCLPLLVVPTAPEGNDKDADDSRSDRTGTVALVDSLFGAAAYDSVMALMPSLLDDAWKDADSSLVARLLVIRGRVELTRGNAERAEQTLDEARRVGEAARDTARWSDALGFKSIAVMYRGKYQESIELNRIRLSLAQLTGDRVSEAWARTTMAYVYLRTGEFERARPEYETAADLFHAENRLREELTPLVGLGRVLMSLQETDAARDCYQRVWRTASELGDLRQEAYAVNNLGSWEFQYGDMSVAARYFERAYDLHARLGDLRGTIVPATNIAIARMYLGQYADAASILSRAIQTCEDRGYEDLVWMVICSFADVRLLQQRANEAASLYRRALTTGRETLSKKQRQEATYGLARALTALDSVETAVSVLRAGLDDAPTRDFDVYMSVLLSKNLRRLGRNDEALARALHAARSAEVVAGHDPTLFSAFELSAAYEATGNDADSYAWYHRCLETLDEFRRTSEEHQWREAHGRIRVVVDGGFIVLKYPPDRAWQERAEELYEILQRFKARTLAERITEPRAQQDGASGLADLPPTGLKELQTVILQPNEVFLDFAVGDETAYLFAITRDSCRVATLPGRKSELSARVAFYIEALNHPPDGSWGGEIEQMGASLYRSLLGPADDLIRSASRVLVAPDSYLSAMPFGTLVLPDPDGGPILLTKEIHHVPSATILKWLRAQPGEETPPGAAGRILAVVPRGSEELKGVAREVAALRNNLSGVEVLQGKPADAAFGNNTHQGDVIHVAAHVVVNDEKPWHSGILLESVASDARPQAADTRETVLERTAAADGVSTGEAGPPAALVDPYLRAREIASLRIPARLVVLSGCESGLGRVSHGEGVLGLTSAFLSAGVPSLVATLWPVDDAVTADLMAAFYDHLANGETAAAALRGAQLDIRSVESTRHPFYWAGFVIVGDGEVDVAIVRSRRSSLAVLFLTGILILLILIVLLRLRPRFRRNPREAV